MLKGGSTLPLLLLLLLLFLFCWIHVVTGQPDHIMDLNTGSMNAPWSVCGCLDCGYTVWNTDAAGFTCGARISYLMDVSRFSANKACRTVSSNEFPTLCGLCNPDTCQQRENQQEQEENNNNNNNAGGSSINNVPPAIANTDHRCGCDLCEQYAWQVNADGYTCGQRIDYLLTLRNLYPTEADACRQVGINEFPAQCGLCNPDHCDGTVPPPPPPPQNHEPPKELYCFPPRAERTRYDNVWGKYTLEVKEGVCGPSDNLFSKNGVSLDDNKNELTLQLGRQTDGRWYAGEVRVLLPADEYYDYGKYTFSVKTIQVYDSVTDGLVGNALPPSVILGLFTWDDTKNYAIKENYNQEVDIELSRWDIKDNEDVQFLVQPPGNPQMYRFYSGAPPTLSLPVYNQAPNTYEFDWEPAEITWSSSAGQTPQTFTYGTQDALDATQPDYTQCMPANVEVRMNIWNLMGTGTPTEMKDTHVVEVVIDSFKYEPSGRKAVPEGGVCSKDCQCGDLMMCVQNQCIPTTNYGDKAPSSSGGGSASDSFSTGNNNNNIAAATNDETQVDTGSSASSFWRDHRWVIFGGLISLVTLLAIISYVYYRQHRYQPAVLVFGPTDKSVATDVEDPGYESSSSLGENDPYRMATTGAGESASTEVAETDRYHVAAGETIDSTDQAKVVSFDDEVELLPPNPYHDVATMVKKPDSTTSSNDASSSNSLRLVKGEGEIEMFHFGDWMKRLRNDATQSKKARQNPHSGDIAECSSDY